MPRHKTIYKFITPSPNSAILLKNKPTLEPWSGSIYTYMCKNYFPRHVTNVLYIGSKILSLIGQQNILYSDF